MSFSTDRVKTIREEILAKGAEITAGDRNIEYGEPEHNFQNVADLWNAYIWARYRGQQIDEHTFSLTPEDVAWLCTLMKVGRTFIGQPKLDTYIDAATYAAIAGELAIKNRRE